ncbi:PBP1A family penicillin-binding protein [Gammaproteobacteria bacterium]|nr:PBP1A family penicillin-binding protein [Gammaproteobacteria bacterium]
MKRFINRLLLLFIILGIAAATILAIYTRHIYQSLPSREEIKQVALEVPLRVYSADDKLIAEFGVEKRTPVTIGDVPQTMIDAILAAEDDNFFNHNGIDYSGLMRAVLANLRPGAHLQGASTITMQVARNYFLTRNRTLERKYREILLSFRMEEILSKNEILELYMNKVFLGHRAYGFAAAAEVYYGSPLSELTLPQFAMLAGIPKAPSDSNPITNPEKALDRRDYVLRRMHQLQKIDDAAYSLALETPDDARKYNTQPEVNAPYIAEMARQFVIDTFGQEHAYVRGYKVKTSIDSANQVAAQAALRHGLMDYDRQHGYAGPIERIDASQLGDSERSLAKLKELPSVAGLQPALIVNVNSDFALARTATVPEISLDFAGVSWASKRLKGGKVGKPPTRIDQVVSVGDVIYVVPGKSGNWELAQVPEVEGAVISMDPNDGRIRALVGGFDFNRTPFNRVTQARRQPGSNIKPFIYSAALEIGVTPATLMNGSKLVFEGADNGDDWRPGNYGSASVGWVRLREALARSLNTVSVRILDRVGVGGAIDHLRRFGFEDADLIEGMSIALGANVTTPLKIATGYSVFANGGFLVEPWLIESIHDGDDQLVYAASPFERCTTCAWVKPVEDDADQLPINTQTIAADQTLIVQPLVSIDATDESTTGQLADALANGETTPIVRSGPRQAERVISPANAYVMTHMMQEAIRSGTATRALGLERDDLAGKTGTTNNFRDAWFTGFTHNLVATTWVGYDTPRSLGRQSSGASVALPIWMEYMDSALNGVPSQPMQRPADVVAMWIDKDTGEPLDGQTENAYREVFFKEFAPDLRTARRESRANDVVNNTDSGLF